MSINVEIKRDPRAPATRSFVITGQPATLDTVYILNSMDDALEAGMPLIEYIFARNAKEVRLFAYDDQDRIAVTFEDPKHWDKLTSTHSTTTFETSIRNFLNSRLNQGELLINEADESYEGDDFLGEINHQISVNVPLVKKHGGTAKAINFDEETGKLTIEFGKTCVSGCPESPFGTRGRITSTLKRIYPKIENVVFVNNPA